MQSGRAQPTLTATSILDQLARLRTESAPDPKTEAARRSYRQAAAVLAAIEYPTTLRPLDESLICDNPSDLLASDLVAATGSRLEGRVLLKHDVRRSALKELGIERIHAALDANPSERTGVIQLQFESYLTGTAKPVEAQTTDELEGTLQALTWLDGIVTELPDKEVVRRQLVLREFTSVFESLAGDDVFQGRETELDRMREYVDVLPPKGLLANIRKKIPWPRPDAVPALSVSGPGGVGKSTLIARFVLEHSRLPAAAKIPFAYLDLDRPALDVAAPLTLLLEMLRQLTLQFSEFPEFQRMYEFRQQHAEPYVSDPAAGPALSQAASIFADLLGTLSSRIGPRPYLVVLDTFERVQYRGETLASPLWSLLGEMQERWPFLRVVVSGRAPVTTLQLAGAAPYSLEIGDLDDGAALAFLRTQGIKSKEIARAIVRQVGGVPLSLKLAAAILKAKPGTELKVQSGFWIKTADEVIQGQLYDRILGQIDDPEVARLAHPGLVLRRITPEAILHVLKEPCKLTVRNLQDATILCDKLRREASLVSTDDSEGALVHRRDLRAVMLKLILQREPALATEVSERAVEWYSKQVGKRARAEEVYHRLLLGQVVGADACADVEVRASLQTSITELPPASQRLLATYGLKVDKAVLKKATAEEKDSILASQVEELLPHQHLLSNARRVLDANGKLKRDTPLSRSEARLRLELGDAKGALDAVELGLRYALEASNSARTYELLREKAWICEALGDEPRLAEALDLLAEALTRHKDAFGTLQHWMQSRRLRGKFVEPALTNDDWKKVRGWIQTIGPRKFFGVVAATRGFWEAAQRLQVFDPNFLASLLLHDEAPFATVGFERSSADVFLQASVAAAYMPDTLLAARLEELLRFWPYRNLEMYPPESRRSYMAE